MRNPLVPACLLLVLGLGVAACGGTTAPAASPGAVAPSAPAGGSTQPATSTSDAVAGGPLVEKTLAILHADPFVGHIDQHAIADTSGSGASSTIDASLSIDINGEDVSGHLEAKSGSVSTSSDIVVIGNAAYVKQDGAWTGPVPRSVVAESMTSLRVAFGIVTSAGQLREVGVEPVEGRQLHRLTKASTIPYSTSAGAAGEYDVLDLWVDDAGTPVVMRASFTGGNGTVTVHGTTDFRFSKIGGPISITLPADAPSPSS